MNRLERDQYLKETAAFLSAMYSFSDREAYALLKKYQLKIRFENESELLLQTPPKKQAELLKKLSSAGEEPSFYP